MSSLNPMRTVLVGSQTLVVHCGELLMARGHEVLAVASADEQVLGWARGVGLETHDDPGDLVKYEVDCLFSVANLEILSADVLRIADRAINFHDGPLPRYAGRHATTWALLAGENRHGVTWHVMTSDVDGGDILVQRTFDVAPDATAFSLNAQCYEMGIATFAELLDILESGDGSQTRQDRAQRTWFGRHQRPETAGVLDFVQPAAHLVRLSRALDFGPMENPVGATKLWTGDRLWIVGRVEERDGNGTPGAILSSDGVSLTVATGKGAVRLSELRWEGRAAVVAQLTSPGSLPDLSDGSAWRSDAEAAASHECFWRPRLLDLQPLARPWYGGDCEHSGQHTAEIEGDGRALLVAYAAYLARTSARSRFDVTLRAGPGDATPVLAPVRPLRVEVDPNASVAVNLEALEAEVEQVLARPLTADLPDRCGAGVALRAARAMVLSLEPQWDPSAEYQVVVHFGTDRVTWRGPGVAAPAHLAHVARFRRFLGSVNNVLRATSILGDGELGALKRRGTGPAPTVPDRCIHEDILTQADRTPDAEAVSDGHTTLTFAELRARSTALAARLRDHGVGPETRVGIYLDRRVDLSVGIVGVLMSGAAFVPLDPAYPQARIAFMLEDAQCRLVVTRDALAPALPPTVRSVCLDAQPSWARGGPVDDTPVGPHHLAYVMYTSGSTGQPKGVLVEHRNVANFFVGMDGCVPRADGPEAWLALTSLSFDISVLELLWSLSRGIHVVLHEASPRRQTGQRRLDFSLMFFASDEGGSPAADKYRLLLESARFGDRHGFRAVWTPERHFHAFGGLYPNPSVASAAIAAVTERIHIRAGSVVSPLHNPIRIAEEWSLVDNLSGGRVGISFAAGWQAQDFVFAPERWADRKAQMFEDIATVRGLWRGESRTFEGPTGPVELQTLPRPIQAELPVWVTAASNPETFVEAGRRGYHLLTHLLGQSVAELREKIAAYRGAWDAAGHSGRGTVTVMLHAFIGDSDAEVKRVVREPMKAYLRSALELIARAAWTFPTFRRAADAAGRTPGEVFEAQELSEEETEALLEGSFERYFQTAGLFGTVQTCQRMVDRVREADVDEIACLLDYGVPVDDVLACLPLLDTLRRACSPTPEGGPASPPVAETLEARSITHLQCTPSQMSLLLADGATEAALERLTALLIGGEPLPRPLAERLASRLPGRVFNMYGPTETTIWSSCGPVNAGPVDLGTPIANTRFEVRDAWGNAVGLGQEGELFIGGAGVVRGYHERPELTAAAFATDADGQRWYRTGDLVRWDDTGLRFLGRADSQVKLRGHRIELGEVEAALARQPNVAEAAATIVHSGPTARLVGYVRPAPGFPLDPEALVTALRDQLPEPLVPALVVALDSLPRTLNGKLDRRALPAPGSRRGLSRQAPPDSDVERTLAALWQEVLGADQIGLHDNFFELGGHSLLAVQLHRLLQERTAWELALTDLFRFPTVGSLARFVSTDDAPHGASAGEKRGAARRRRRPRRKR